MTDIEIWKDIPGYEGLYEASTLGNIRRSNYRNTGKPRLLKPIGNGVTRKYLIVHLCKNSIVEDWPIHQLVALTFIPNPDNLPEVDHRNTIKTDNRLSNLQWATSADNSNNPLTIKHYQEAAANREKFRSVPVKCIETQEEFMSINQAIKKYGRIRIREACLNSDKTAGGYHWQYI